MKLFVFILLSFILSRQNHPWERLGSTLDDECSVLWEVTISTVGSYHQYCGGIPSALWSKYPLFWWYPPTVLMVNFPSTNDRW